jgi:hypothetical protein
MKDPRTSERRLSAALAVALVLSAGLLTWAVVGTGAQTCLWAMTRGTKQVGYVKVPCGSSIADILRNPPSRDDMTPSLAEELDAQTTGAPRSGPPAREPEGPWIRVLSDPALDPKWVLYEKVSRHRFCQAVVGADVDPNVQPKRASSSCGPRPTWASFSPVEALDWRADANDGPRQRVVAGKVALGLDRIQAVGADGTDLSVFVEGDSFVAVVAGSHLPAEVFARSTTGSSFARCRVTGSFLGGVKGCAAQPPAAPRK